MVLFVANVLVVFSLAVSFNGLFTYLLSTALVSVTLGISIFTIIWKLALRPVGSERLILILAAESVALIALTERRRF